MAEWKPKLLRFVEGGEGKFPGGKFQLPPMNSFQRRVVHALAEECGLQQLEAPPPLTQYSVTIFNSLRSVPTKGTWNF